MCYYYKTFMGRIKTNLITISSEDIAARYGVKASAIENFLTREKLSFSNLDDFIEVIMRYEARARLSSEKRLSIASKQSTPSQNPAIKKL
jgi:predicted DNA-binding protein YlxM (UPF0122 family)